MFKSVVGFCKKVVTSVKKGAVVAIAAIGAAVASAVAVPVPAHAVGLTMPTIDLTDMYAAAGVLLTAVAAIWVIAKVIGFFRSR